VKDDAVEQASQSRDVFRRCWRIVFCPKRKKRRGLRSGSNDHEGDVGHGLLLWSFRVAIVCDAFRVRGELGGGVCVVGE